MDMPQVLQGKTDFMPAVTKQGDAPIWEDPALALNLCRAIIDNIIAAFVAMDMRGICIEWNRQAEQVFGWSRAEALGRSVAELIIPENIRELHWAGLRRFAESGSGPLLNKTVEVNSVCKDGRKIPCTLTIVPMPWRGEPLFAAFIADISEQKLAYAKLQASYDQLAQELMARTKLEDEVEGLKKALESQGISTPHMDVKQAAERLKEIGERLRKKVLPHLMSDGQSEESTG
jgi:PAS domain S-box-containing protein